MATVAIASASQHRSPALGVVNISMNGTRLANTQSVTCREKVVFHFDQVHCDADIMISPDKLTVFHTGKPGYSSVLGSRGVRQGHLSWRVRINQCTSKKAHFFVGVTTMDKH